MGNLDLIELSEKVSKFVVGFEGNVSKKNNDKFVIKSSGKKLSKISENDFVTYDFKLNQIDNFNNKGSIELNFHHYFLSFEGINYVCHTHPTQTMKILCSSKIYEFAEKRIFPDQVVFNGKNSCVIPYVKPGVELKKIIELEISKWISNYGQLPKLILLKNHGIITFGKTIDECVIKTEICEKSAEIFLGASIHGIDFLTVDEVNELLNDEKEKYRIKQL